MLQIALKNSISKQELKVKFEADGAKMFHVFIGSV
jgi:hypothetical protein